jgi:hypothetical protein
MDDQPQAKRRGALANHAEFLGQVAENFDADRFIGKRKYL